VLAPVAPATLAPTLGGVSLRLTVGGTSVDVLPTFVASSQINAIIPSTAPLGTGQLVITYNGVPSDPAPVRIVKNALGIFTMGSSSSAGIIQTFAVGAPEGQRPLNSKDNTAAPGDYGIVWATGLGANVVNGQTLSDTEQPQPRGNMDVPITITIGGIRLSAAQMPWQGRSGYNGVDNVYFIVPPGVPSGCAVPVQIQVGDMMANTVTIAIDPQRQTCTDSGPSGSPGGFANPANPFGPLFAPGNTKIGGAVLEHVNAALDLWSFGNPIKATLDFAVAGFIQFPSSAPKDSFAALPSLGSCAEANLANSFGGNVTSNGPSALTGLVTNTLGATYLDAGNDVWVLRGTKPSSGADTRTATQLKKEPSRPQDLSYYATGSSNTLLTAGNPGFLFDDTYELTNASTGGQGQVGLFSVTFDTAGAFNFQSNAAKFNTIDRAQPLNITWTGGRPSKEAVVIVTGNLDRNTDQYIGVQCLVPMAPGQFSIPSSYLSRIPTSPPPNNPDHPDWMSIDGLLIVKTQPYGTYSAFGAQGIDKAVLSFGSLDVKTVRFK
jgi:uncharacterized protein (TIGR03437 family)